MILIIDNFDSFTYNLVDYFNQLAEECEVVRNDIEPHLLSTKKYKAVVLSPGPGKPEDAGFLLSYIEKFHTELPVLGICLGHQAIAKFYGATIKKAIKPMHGKISKVKLLKDDALFKGIRDQFEVVRYHSLVVADLPKAILTSLAETEEGENMILKHESLPLYGIQYHPEAALTQHGLEILGCWISIVNSRSHAVMN